MIAFLLALVPKLGSFYNSLIGKIITFLLVFCLLVGGFMLGLHFYKAAVINAYLADQKAASLQTQLMAAQEANKRLAIVAAVQQATQSRVHSAVQSAVSQHPAEAASPVGPATAAYYDALSQVAK